MPLAVPTSTTHYFPSGYAATAGTLRLMAAIVTEQAHHPRMRARALELFRGLASNDIDGEIARVWDHVLGQVRYMRDPLGAEHITKPVTLDEQVDRGVAAEDCESMALYAATLFAAVGIPSEFEVQGVDPSLPKKFKHCALDVINPRTGKRTPFDVVGAIEFPNAFLLGDTMHRPGEPIERWTLDGERASMYFEQTNARGDLRGALLGDVDSADVEKYVRGTVDAIKTVAPAFGPYGALAAGLIQIGEFIYDKETGKPVGPAPKLDIPGVPPPGPKKKFVPGLRRGNIVAGPGAAIAEVKKANPEASSSGPSAAAVVGGGLAAGLLIRALFV